MPKQDTPQRAASGTVVVKRVSQDATPTVSEEKAESSSLLITTVLPTGRSLFYFLSNGHMDYSYTIRRITLRTIHICLCRWQTKAPLLSLVRLVTL